MILAISGKKQSGKDLVGEIIQFLIAQKKGYQGEFNENFKLPINAYKLSGWEIKKFADKLKDIVTLLIGCTKEQLEDEDFKNTKLKEEWWFYKNKDGEIIKGYLDVTKKELEKWKKLSYVHQRFKPTVRHFLQFIGTDLFRKYVHPNTWVNSLMSEYKKQVVQFGEFVDGGPMMTRKYPDWIITDLRFPNELKAVKDRGGITIRVKRPCNECGGVGYHKMDCSKGRSEHISEKALDGHTFDYTIINDGTIEELIEKVKEILIKEKII